MQDDLTPRETLLRTAEAELVREAQLLRTEQHLGMVLTVGTRCSSACLAVALVLTFVAPGWWVTSLLLTSGLIVLMSTPVARVALSVVEFARVRDWPFVTYTLIVLLLLVGSVVAAVLE